MESYESYEDYVPQESSIDEVQVYYEAQQREQVRIIIYCYP